MVARTSVDLTGLIAALLTRTSTPDIRFACLDSQKLEVVADVARRLRMAGAEIVDIDGVRVNIGGGKWWLLRASYAEDALTARCEGRDAVGLDQAKHALFEVLREAGLKIDRAVLYADSA